MTHGRRAAAADSSVMEMEGGVIFEIVAICQDGMIWFWVLPKYRYVMNGGGICSGKEKSDVV